MVEVGGRAVPLNEIKNAQVKYGGGFFNERKNYYVGGETISGRLLNEYLASESGSERGIPHASITLHKRDDGGFELATVQGNTTAVREQLTKFGVPTTDDGEFFIPDDEKGKVGRTVHDNANRTGKVVMGVRQASERDISDKANRLLARANGSPFQALLILYGEAKDGREAAIIEDEIRKVSKETKDNFGATSGMSG